MGVKVHLPVNLGQETREIMHSKKKKKDKRSNLLHGSPVHSTLLSIEHVTS